MVRPGTPMRAIQIRRFGGTEALEQTAIEAPHPMAGELLVEVAFCGVCRHDLLTRAGAFPSIALPVVLGHQVAGTVVAAGEGTRTTVGTRVMTMIYRGCGECPHCSGGDAARCATRRPDFLGEDFDGGYADAVAVPEQMVVPVPAGFDLAAAAVLTCTYGTAYHALVTRGNLGANETWLVTGAGGGVGIHAVSLVAALGARAIAVTSSAAKAQALRDAGAWRVIVAPDLNFARETKQLTAGSGVDGVLEIVGSRALGQSLRAVRDGGRIVVLGNVDGASADVPPAILILKELTLLGTKSCSRTELEVVLAMIADGRLDVADVTRIGLQDVAHAHQLLADGTGSGRIVLEVGGEPAR